MKLRKQYKLGAAVLAVMMMTALFSSCNAGWEDLESVDTSNNTSQISDAESLPKSDVSSSAADKPVDNGSTEGKLDLFAAGDNILHEAVINGGKTADGGYDYTGYYEYMANDIQNADVAFINQESPIGGEALGISGYPNFNSPFEIGDNLVSLGFDVINQANNHMLDKGAKGVTATLEFWKKYPQIAVLGINASQEERDTTRIVERNGIKLAFLSYTYGTNGYKTPSGQEYLVNRFDKAAMKADVERAKKEADAVVVSMHWGVEYSTTTSSEQHTYAQYLADLGVDLVIGTHPHVIQRVNWVTGENGNKTLVYYSLGNFLSSQIDDPLRMLGAVANVRFEKKDGETTITDAKITPTICHYETNNGVREHFKIYKLSEYTDALAAQHGIKDFLNASFGREMTLSTMKNICRNVLGDWYTEGK